jgi:hypothetical protein
MKAADKNALNDWDEFRKSISESTPVDIAETHEEKIKRIKMLEADPQAWKKYYFPKFFKYESPDFHVEASERMRSNFTELGHWYEVRNWARGLSKTTTLMFDVMYLVLTGQLKAPIFYTSSTYDAAEAFLTKYQCQLDSNQRIIADYGQQERPGMWGAGDFTTLKGVRFIALGAGQSPRGASSDELRPGCIILDDFDTDQECLNPDIIQKKWDWFEKALLFTVDVSEPYLIIWLGNIIAEDCCIVRAGAMADYQEAINIRDDYGVSVWPEKNSEEVIDYLISKATYAASQQEFFNNPVRTGRTFPEMRWGHCPPLKECPFIVVYADPATSNKDKPTLKSKALNSCKAIVVVGFKGTARYVYRCYVDNMNNSHFIDYLYAAKAYSKDAKALYTFIENNSLQNPFYEQVLKPMINKKGKEKGVYLAVTPDTRKKDDKFTRIEATLEPLNREGNLILNIDEANDPHMKRLESQFKAVSPNSKTMDAPDATEGAVFIINNKASSLSTNIKVLKASKPRKSL